MFCSCDPNLIQTKLFIFFDFLGERKKGADVERLASLTAVLAAAVTAPYKWCHYIKISLITILNEINRLYCQRGFIFTCTSCIAVSFRQNQNRFLLFERLSVCA